MQTSGRDASQKADGGEAPSFKIEVAAPGKLAAISLSQIASACDLLGICFKHAEIKKETPDNICNSSCSSLF